MWVQSLWEGGVSGTPYVWALSPPCTLDTRPFAQGYVSSLTSWCFFVFFSLSVEASLPQVSGDPPRGAQSLGESCPVWPLHRSQLHLGHWLCSAMAMAQHSAALSTVSAQRCWPCSGLESHTSPLGKSGSLGLLSPSSSLFKKGCLRMMFTLSFP